MSNYGNHYSFGRRGGHRYTPYRPDGTPPKFDDPEFKSWLVDDTPAPVTKPKTPRTGVDRWRTIPDVVE